jgi:hypothetical protein
MPVVVVNKSELLDCSASPKGCSSRLRRICQMKAQTRVKENSEKKENKTERSMVKTRSEKVEIKREDLQYNEEIRR